MTISTSGNKILSFYHDAQKLRSGEMIVPRMVSIWLTTGCDLDCVYCWCHDANRQFKLADTTSVKWMIDEIAAMGVEGLEFGGGGEPTLHPDCFEIAEYASARGLKVGILTNGFRFDMKRLTCFHYVRISLEAHSARIYQLVKRGNPGRFEETCSLVRQLVKERAGGKRPRIGLKFMLCRENYSYIIEMATFALNLGADYCQFNPVQFCNSALSLEEAGKANEDIERIQEAFPGFVYGRTKSFVFSTSCFLSPIHAVVMPEGNVPVCCFFGKEEYQIGNAFRDGFVYIWYSQRHWDIMAAIPHGECARIDCRWHHYNAEMARVLDDGEYDLTFI